LNQALNPIAQRTTTITEFLKGLKLFEGQIQIC